MRSTAQIFALFLLLPGVALAADASCEYRHPDHPTWDFFSACSYETVMAEGAETTTVTVRNGSTFTTVDAETDTGTRVTVNGLAASRLERGESRCYLTDADAELICIHPPGTAAAEAPATPIAAAPVATGLAGFGGGQTGYCLLSETSGAAESLTEYGACVKRENCLESEDGGTSCVTDYDWASGRITEMARAAGWHTLDGGAVEVSNAGCFVDAAGGVRFCYSRKKMTVADHPVLATAAP